MLKITQNTITPKTRIVFVILLANRVPYRDLIFNRYKIQDKIIPKNAPAEKVNKAPKKTNKEIIIITYAGFFACSDFLKNK